jgi:hypothetical protein
MSAKLQVCVVMQTETLAISLPVEALNMNYIIGQTVIINSQAWTIKSVELSEVDSSMLILRCRPSERRKAKPNRQKQGESLHAE